MSCAIGSLFSRRFIRWKKFSIGLISGLCAGIESNFARTDFIAFLDVALFWLGPPSCNQRCERPFFVFLNVFLNSLNTRFLNYCPSNLSYCSHSTTPPWLIATIFLTSLPPDPSWLPFAVHPLSRPSLGLLQIRPFGWLSLVCRICLVCKAYRIQIECNFFCPNATCKILFHTFGKFVALSNIIISQ